MRPALPSATPQTLEVQGSCGRESEERLAQLRAVTGFTPARGEQLVAWEPPSLEATEILGRLAAGVPRGRPDLVGNLNQKGGSGGHYGRFFEIGGWFLKARLTKRYRSLADALEDDGVAERQRRSLGIYHPDRSWFVTRDEEDGYWACSLTPLLPLLRDRFNEAADREAWELFLAAIRGTLELGRQRSLWLDCNPNNFGLAAGGLVYVDDDLALAGPRTAVGLQALLRLREYSSANMQPRLEFLAGFAELAVQYSHDPAIRSGLLGDLANELLWPREPELRALLGELGRRLSSTRNSPPARAGTG